MKTILKRCSSDFDNIVSSEYSDNNSIYSQEDIMRTIAELTEQITLKITTYFPEVYDAYLDYKHVGFLRISDGRVVIFGDRSFELYDRPVKDSSGMVSLEEREEYMQMAKEMIADYLHAYSPPIPRIYV